MIDSAVSRSPERASAIARCPCERRASTFIQVILALLRQKSIAAAASPCGGMSAVKKLRA